MQRVDVLSDLVYCFVLQNKKTPSQLIFFKIMSKKKLIVVFSESGTQLCTVYLCLFRIIQFSHRISCVTWGKPEQHSSPRVSQNRALYGIRCLSRRTQHGTAIHVCHGQPRVSHFSCVIYNT